MKKFIVLTLVLSMASLASAALSIGVNGDPNPVDSEITIAPSDTLLLDLRSDGADFGVYFMLFVDNAAGTITAPPSDLNWIMIYPPYCYYYLPPNTNGIVGVIEGFEPGSGIVIDQIDFHCEAPGDALIELWTSPDSAVWSLADTVVIHQVSEPTTPLIGVDPYILDFFVEEYRAKPDDQVLSVWNDGAGILDWTIEKDWPNLTVTPDSGTSSGEVNAVVASVELSGLPQGIYISDFTVSDPNAANSPQTVTAVLTNECIFNDSPMYDDWVGAGKNWNRPDCWCCVYQCRGDADCNKAGFFWVDTTDLVTFIAAYGKGDSKLDQELICADFDHIKVGFFRVQTNDLLIFIAHYGKGQAKFEECPLDWDGDGDDDYNFWITP